MRYLSAFLIVMWFFSEAVAQKETVEDSLIADIIYDYSTTGYNNVKYNINLDTAEYYLKRALDLQYTLHNYEIDHRVARNHINLATVYRRLFNNSKSLYHLNEAEKILEREDPNSALFGHIYNNKGNIIKTNYDIYRTRQYYEYALDWLIKTGNKNTEDFLKIYSNYLDVLFQLQEYDIVSEYLSNINIETLSLSPELEFDFYTIKGDNFAILGMNKEAIQQYTLAKKLLENEELASNIYLSNTYYYKIISFYITIKDYNQAYKEIAGALLFVESLDRYSRKLQTVYHSSFQHLYAYILSEEGKYERALAVIDEVTDDLNIFFHDQSLTELNSEIRNENSSLLPELYTLRSRVLYKLYQKNSSSKTLINAFEAYKHSISILNSTKISIQNEDSKFYATGQILEVYNEAINVGRLLYEMTDEIEYLEKSFEFAESSKSFALFSEIKDVEAMEFSGLPPDVKEKEDRLIGEIQAYEEMLYEGQISTDPDSILLESYRDILFHLKDDYNDLMQEIEVNNARYFELKYNPTFVTLEGVQKELPYRDALIEYVLTDTMLITYVIDRKNINVFSQEIGPEFADECLEYYQLLHTQNFSSGVHDNYRRFVSLGRKFYKVLIEPCLEYTDRKSFTIVPDGAISYLPFEGLLTKDTDTEYIDYLDLPYMIRDYSVGYSHSSTLMFSERLKTKSPERKVLAFAPKYNDPLGNTTSELVRQSLLESDYLMPLGGIIKEVQSINETVPSRVFLNEKATEANFKKYASDYNVLHLAMHTIMRDDEPLYSHLAFTNIDTGDTIEDNKLYAYEIYNMKLNAQMAVLSSCSSGFGKMQKGEGMMSLARGFIYAGCPSIIMTLWQVSDQSSSDLMTSFYKYLKKGKSKQESMRLAKIDFLDAADDLTSNPYFWSGFVVVGDGSPIYRKSGIAYWMIIITVFIGILVYLQYYNRS